MKRRTRGDFIRVIKFRPLYRYTCLMGLKEDSQPIGMSTRISLRKYLEVLKSYERSNARVLWEYERIREKLIL